MFKKTLSCLRDRSSGESGDGLALFRVDLDQRQEADHFQGLYRQLGGAYQFQRAAALFCAGERPDEDTDSAGVDHVDFLHVDDEAGLVLSQPFFNRLPQVFGGLADFEVASEANDTSSSPFLEEFPDMRLRKF